MEFKIETSKAIGFELVRMALRIEEIRLSMDEDEIESDHLKRIRSDLTWLAGRMGGPELTL